MSTPFDRDPGDKSGKKYPKGTVVIWIAVSAIGFWMIGTGLVGILSGS